MKADTFCVWFLMQCFVINKESLQYSILKTIRLARLLVRKIQAIQTFSWYKWRLTGAYTYKQNGNGGKYHNKLLNMNL